MARGGAVVGSTGRVGREVVMVGLLSTVDR